MKPLDIANYFDISIDTVINTRLKYKCTYDELFEEYKDRIETIKECQDICLTIKPREIQDLFGSNVRRYNNTIARNFLRTLYCVTDIPRKDRAKKCKEIIKYLREKDGTNTTK